MRPAEFTLDAIIQAGQDLQTAGRNITGFALRQKVGGGNPSRLKQVWDEHQNSQASTVADTIAELPVEVAEVVASVSKSLADRLATLAVELNDKAVKAADRRVHEVVRNAAEQLSQADRELSDAATTVEELEAKLDEANARIDDLQAKLAHIQGVNQSLAVDLGQVRERLAATEHAAKAAAELAKDDALRTTERLSAAVAERNNAQKVASAAREETANLVGKVEALQNQVAQLTKALATRPVVEPQIEIVKPAHKASK